MKRKIMTITYTCPEDKANLGEAEIMGYIIQKLGELGAYDINMKASSMNLVEPLLPNGPKVQLTIPEFMQERQRETERIVDRKGEVLWENGTGIQSRRSGAWQSVRN